MNDNSIKVWNILIKSLHIYTQVQYLCHLLHNIYYIPIIYRYILYDHCREYALWKRARADAAAFVYK